MAAQTVRFTDEEVLRIALKVRELMREPDARRGCRCGECHNCLSRQGMARTRQRRRERKALETK